VSNAWTYGPRLREIRQARGLSQEEAAAKVGVRLGSYGAWERGGQNPTLENINAIADAFEIDPRELGYSPPEGWDLVPSEWIRAEFEQQRVALRELKEMIEVLVSRR